MKENESYNQCLIKNYSKKYNYHLSFEIFESNVIQLVWQNKSNNFQQLCFTSADAVAIVPHTISTKLKILHYTIFLTSIKPKKRENSEFKKNRRFQAKRMNLWKTVFEFYIYTLFAYWIWACGVLCEKVLFRAFVSHASLCILQQISLLCRRTGCCILTMFAIIVCARQITVERMSTRKVYRRHDFRVDFIVIRIREVILCCCCCVFFMNWWKFLNRFEKALLELKKLAQNKQNTNQLDWVVKCVLLYEKKSTCIHRLRMSGFAWNTGWYHRVCAWRSVLIAVFFVINFIVILITISSELS